MYFIFHYTDFNRDSQHLPITIKYSYRKVVLTLVSYDPLWKTLEEKGITTYTLIEKHKVLSKTIYNLKHDKNISTTTLETLCKILDCTPNDILTFKD
jgi:Predicted transcriptional regulator